MVELVFQCGDSSVAPSKGVGAMLATKQHRGQVSSWPQGPAAKQRTPSQGNDLHRSCTFNNTPATPTRTNALAPRISSKSASPRCHKTSSEHLLVALYQL
jgi:hypothetical protein